MRAALASNSSSSGAVDLLLPGADYIGVLYVYFADGDMSRNVLVIGMHRSGTSATTRMIGLAGLEPVSQRISSQAPCNETGHWESTTLTELNERLLVQMHSAWWCPPPLSRHYDISAALAAEADAAGLAFKRTHSDAPWVWKDPRNCVSCYLSGVVSSTPFR